MLRLGLANPERGFSYGPRKVEYEYGEEYLQVLGGEPTRPE